MVPTVREVQDEPLGEGSDRSRSARRAAWGRFRPFAKWVKAVWQWFRPFAKWVTSGLAMVPTVREVQDEPFGEGSDRCWAWLGLLGWRRSLSVALSTGAWIDTVRRDVAVGC